MGQIGRLEIELFLIGGSAGSLKVLLDMLPAVRPDLTFPVVLILHRKAGPESMLDILLANHSNMGVVEVEDKTTLQPGTVYLAPADYHLLFEHKSLLSLDCSEKLNYSRPSIDVSFQSAADIFRGNVGAMLLSGANADGAEGLAYIKKSGGLTVAQDPSTAEVAYMPARAIERGAADHILPPGQMASFINNLSVSTN